MTKKILVGIWAYKTMKQAQKCARIEEGKGHKVTFSRKTDPGWIVVRAWK